MAASSILFQGDNLTMYAVILLVTLLILYIFKTFVFYQNPGKKIPGPSLLRGLKIFLEGSRKNTLHLLVPKLAEEYGDIFQIDTLVRKTVFINDGETFRRLVKDREFRELTNDRPTMFIGKYYHDFKGVIFADHFGSVAHQKRTIFHNLLKFYGEGKLQFEDRMVETLNKLVQRLSQKDSVDLHSTLHNYILSLISFLLDGDISDNATPKHQAIANYSLNGEKIVMFENETFLQSFPFLRFIPGLRFRELHETSWGGFKRMADLFLDSGRDTFDPSQKRGMVDDMLEMQNKAKNSGGDILMDDKTIAALIADVASAGFLTTSSTLSSLFLYLIKNQDIQEKIYQEIQSVIGDSVPSFQHRHKMPYTEAAILETLRITGILPFLLPHKAREDFVFDGYFIPKSSVLIMNAWHAHHRPDHWDDPFRFKPERFLDAEGQLLSADHQVRQRLVPFGIGRRGCPGETFGKSRAFLVTAFLIQKFQFLPPKNGELPSSDARNWEGVTVLVPDKYTCTMKPRKATA